MSARFVHFKYLAALEFDHLDPTAKEFTISGNHCRSWDVIKRELDKCVLRCANCHRERHDNERKTYPYHADMRPVPVVETMCKNCGGKFKHHFSKTRVFCSSKCAGSATRKIEWPSPITLLERLRASSFRAVANSLGVSDNAVRKHLVKNGIDPKSIK